MLYFNSVIYFKAELKPYDKYFRYNDQTDNPTIIIDDENESDDEDDDEHYFGLRVDDFELFDIIKERRVYDDLQAKLRGTLLLSGNICQMKRSRNPTYRRVENVT